jgi:hypothetical protein
VPPVPRYNQHTDKTPVLTLVSNGHARSRIVTEVNGWTLRKAIAEHVDIAGSVLDTDEGSQ